MDDLSTVEARIANHCRIFGCEPVALEYDAEDPDHADAVLLTDELVAWIEQNGASFSWIAVGNTEDLVTAYKRKADGEQKLLKVTRELSEGEVRALSIAMKAALHDGADMDAIMAEYKAVVEEARAAA